MFMSTLIQAPLQAGGEMTTAQQQQTHHLSELDSTAIDSVNSSPRSDYTTHHRSQEDIQPRVRFMCSFGGQIIPRPHDNQLRYVGGDTRIVAVHRFTNYSSLLSKLSKLCGGSLEFTVKYQLPNEDLDALISVSTDEDVENMMEEYDRLLQNGNPKTARLRLFLFPNSMSRTSSIGSLVSGSTRRDQWFLDALNGGRSGAPLERNQSEVSSIVSEVPDYLFGLDNNSDFGRDIKPKSRSHLAENVSVSDPGSPAPVLNSPYCSTSSATGVVSSIPDLPPVKTKPENPTPVSAVDHRQSNMDAAGGGEPLISQPHQQQTGGYAGKPMWHYVQPETHYSTQPVQQQMPVYYIPGPVPSQMQVQQVPVSIPIPMQQQPQPQPQPQQYVQRFPIPSGQVPVSYRQQVQPVGQMYGGGEYQTGAIPDAMSQQQQVYYGGRRNVGVAPGYQAAVVSVGPDVQVSGGVDTKLVRVHQV